ncbi:Spy/CpxP family protein refolding chaperone [Fontibacter flavus]|uniref:Spy/CpxP family protein refolding chaperone n=1 Tax=Fontibacter flavus TaxID=654838 RepID=A0ABV6FQ38_9BACT
MKNITLLILMVFLSFSGYAQRQGQQYDKEKLEAARVAFITNRLDLKPVQAEKFWPIFNQYQEDRTKLMEQMSKLNRAASQETNEVKAREMVEQRFAIQQELLDREKLFMSNIMQVISPLQAVKLSGVNRDFTRQLYRMNQSRDRENKNNL